MDLTFEVFQQQLEIARLYKDDKFASLLKQCRDELKRVKTAHDSLDEREKSLKEREKLCEVITNSQTAFNEQKKAAEAAILEDQQQNQRDRDAIASDRANVDADLKAAADLKAEAEIERKRAETARKSAETKDSKAQAALEEAEAAQAKWEARLLEIGLKPAA